MHSLALSLPNRERPFLGYFGLQLAAQWLRGRRPEVTASE